MILIKTLTFMCIFATLNNVKGKKVDDDIHYELGQGRKPNVIVECKKPHSPESSRKAENILKELKEVSQNPDTSRTNVVTHLVQQQQDTVVSSLEKVIGVLRKLRVKFKILWISYEIFIPEVTLDVISQLVKIDVVLRIRREQTIPRIPPQSPGSLPAPQGNKTWNIGLIDARCKGIKCLGKGVTVGFMDNGVRPTHEEIKDNWIGKDTPFGYMNGFLESCDPEDTNGLGTGAVATAVGKSVGVAPEAIWMMCKACVDGACYESSLKVCALWLACPYECSDETEDKVTKNCTVRPNVINNSWYFTPYDLLYESQLYYFLYEYIEYWNSLGIISIFAAGDTGPGCSTVGYPAGYDNVIAVGSTNELSSLSSFSSVGPTLSTKPLTKDSISVGTCSNSSNNIRTCALIKPTIVAPGEPVRSAGIINDTDFQYLYGTYAATAHATGVVALMLCANPTVRWNYKLAYEILTTTTDTSRIDILGERHNKNDSRIVYTNLRCNVMASNICNTFPNNLYGYGILNACKAVEASKKLLGGSNFGWK